MIFDTSSNILRAIILFALYGTVCGGIYPALSIIFAWANKILTAEIRVIKAKNLFPWHDPDNSAINARSKATESIYDFLFFVTCCLMFCIFMYVASDGVFRVYLLFVFVTAFLLAEHSLGSVFKRIIYLLLSFIYKIWFLILAILTIPFKLLLRPLSIFARALSTRISALYYRRRYNAILSRKFKQINYMFENNS